MSPSRLILAVCVALAVPEAAASQSHVEVSGFSDVEEASQEASQWCWAASIQAVLKYFGVSRSQAEIVQATYGRTENLPAYSPYQLYNALNNFRVNGRRLEVVRGNFGNGSALTASALYRLLNADQPIIAWLANPQGGGHSVVIYAADFAPNGTPIRVTIFDPWPGEGQKTVSAQPFGSRIQAFFIVRGAHFGEIVAADSSSEDDRDLSALAVKYRNCIRTRVNACRIECRDKYGYGPSQCVMLCDPESAINAASWEPRCRRAAGLKPDDPIED